jgi:hypothetical protein
MTSSGCSEPFPSRSEFVSRLQACRSPRPAFLRPSRLDLTHLECESCGRENSLAEKDVRESDDPAFVVAQLADHFGPECLDAAALFLGVDDLVEVEDVGHFRQLAMRRDGRRLSGTMAASRPRSSGRRPPIMERTA